MSWLKGIVDLAAQRSYGEPTEHFLNTRQWTAYLSTRLKTIDSPIERTILSGYLSPSVGLAFVAGYQSALQVMVPSLKPTALTAFCVTEAAGNSPSAIKTKLHCDSDRNTLSGEKSFILGADTADQLLVVASVGVEEQRNKLRVVLIDSDTPGVSLTSPKPLPMVPEVKHGAAEFNSVQVHSSQLLSGDGYLEYVKPFRTLEDIHVFAALLAYVFKIASQFGLSHELRQRILSALSSHVALAAEPPLNSSLHLALAGAQAGAIEAIAAFDAESVAAVQDTTVPETSRQPDTFRAAWERDKAVLNIAGSARVKRLAAAWTAVESN